MNNREDSNMPGMYMGPMIYYGTYPIPYQGTYPNFQMPMQSSPTEMPQYTMPLNMQWNMDYGMLQMANMNSNQYIGNSRFPEEIQMEIEPDE